ncbi:MAG: metallophosphoesterase [Pseudomonadota bacterium]
MKSSIFPAWLAGLFALAFAFSGCASADEANAPARIIAIGDLHGDYEAFEALLNEAGLTDKRGRWTGGEAILVQTGDVPDRGPDSLKIIERLQDLQKKAPRKGGQVVTLVGNHEAMNVTGDLRYVHPGEYKAFANRNPRQRREATYEANRDAIESFYLEQDSTLSSNDIKEKWFEATPAGKLEHQRAWRPDGDIGEWIVGNPAVAIIGDSLFVHGGISQEYASISVADMNAMTREALNSRATEPGSILYDEKGPLWYRGNVGMDPDDTAAMETGAEAPDTETTINAGLSQADEIDLVLETFSVARIVIGHTPSLGGIRVTHGGKVIQIDTGISGYYGGTQSFLEIAGGALIAHDNGVATPINTEGMETETP